jgi:hypothetical protein
MSNIVTNLQATPSFRKTSPFLTSFAIQLVHTSIRTFLLLPTFSTFTNTIYKQGGYCGICHCSILLSLGTRFISGLCEPSFRALIFVTAISPNVPLRQSPRFSFFQQREPRIYDFNNTPNVLFLKRSQPHKNSDFDTSIFSKSASFSAVLAASSNFEFLS